MSKDEQSNKRQYKYYEEPAMAAGDGKPDMVKSSELVDEEEVSDMIEEAVGVVEKELDLGIERPSIGVHGCGGCGIRLQKHLLNKHPNYDSIVHYKAFDTSTSDIDGLPKVVELHLTGKTGSGMDKKANIEAIQSYVDKMTDLANYPQINIIMFSASGASGCVFAHFLGKALAMHDKAVYFIPVMDDMCKVGTRNSVTTIRGFNNVAKDEGFYYPMKLFSNMKKVPESAVNDSVVTRVTTMLEMFTNRYITRLDVNDLINFSNPLGIGQASPGCYGFHVTSDLNDKPLPGEVPVEIDDNTVAFTSLSINPAGERISMNTNMAYAGSISKDKEFYAINGVDLPESVIKDVMLAMDKYDNMGYANNEHLSKLDKLSSTRSSSGIEF